MIALASCAWCCTEHSARSTRIVAWLMAQHGGGVLQQGLGSRPPDTPCSTAVHTRDMHAFPFPCAEPCGSDGVGGVNAAMPSCFTPRADWVACVKKRHLKPHGIGAPAPPLEVGGALWLREGIGAVCAGLSAVEG